MAHGRTIAVQLTHEERKALERCVRARKGGRGLALRSRIVLLAAEGRTNEAIAKRVGVSSVTVRTWRRRFVENGLAGLHDEPRPGRPRAIDDDRVQAVLAATRESTPEPETAWSTRSMARAMGMSQSAISRIWRAFGVTPNASSVSNTPVEPAVVESVRGVVGVYVSPAESAVAFSAGAERRGRDPERASSIQEVHRAREMPSAPHPRRLELLSALGIAPDTGADVSEPPEFLDFLDALEDAVPSELAVHVIVGELSIEKTAHARRWLWRHPRVRLHVGSVRESWLDEVIRWVSRVPKRHAQSDDEWPMATLRATMAGWLQGARDDSTGFAWVLQNTIESGGERERPISAAPRRPRARQEPI